MGSWLAQGWLLCWVPHRLTYPEGHPGHSLQRKPRTNMAEGKDVWVWASRRPACETRPDFLNPQEPEEAADKSALRIFWRLAALMSLAWLPERDHSRLSSRGALEVFDGMRWRHGFSCTGQGRGSHVCCTGTVVSNTPLDHTFLLRLIVLSSLDGHMVPSLSQHGCPKAQAATLPSDGSYFLLSGWTSQPPQRP